MPERTCHYCDKPGELRPYGPGGSFVCFPCATATPEREAAASGAFGALLNANAAIGSGVVAIGGGEDGPIPFDVREQTEDEPDGEPAWPYEQTEGTNDD